MNNDPRPQYEFIPVIGMQAKLSDSERYGTGRKVTVHLNRESGIRAEFESCGVSEAIRMSPEAAALLASLIERMAPGFLDLAREWSQKPLTIPPPAA